MRDSMKDKVALVTGAAAGIGRAAALAYAAAGARVLASDVQREAGEETCELIRSRGGEAIFFACDVARDDQVAAMVAEAERRFGGLDIACNTPGWRATPLPPPTRTRPPGTG